MYKVGDKVEILQTGQIGEVVALIPARHSILLVKLEENGIEYEREILEEHVAPVKEDG